MDENQTNLFRLCALADDISSQSKKHQDYWASFFNKYSEIVSENGVYLDQLVLSFEDKSNEINRRKEHVFQNLNSKELYRCDAILSRFDCFPTSEKDFSFFSSDSSAISVIEEFNTDVELYHWNISECKVHVTRLSKSLLPSKYSPLSTLFKCPTNSFQDVKSFQNIDCILKTNKNDNLSDSTSHSSSYFSVMKDYFRLNSKTISNLSIKGSEEINSSLLNLINEFNGTDLYDIVKDIMIAMKLINYNKKNYYLKTNSTHKNTNVPNSNYFINSYNRSYNPLVESQYSLNRMPKIVKKFEYSKLISASQKNYYSNFYHYNPFLKHLTQLSKENVHQKDSCRNSFLMFPNRQKSKDFKYSNPFISTNKKHYSCINLTCDSKVKPKRVKFN